MADTANKRIQAISAIYEISQDLDSVPIGELLKRVTKKAASVMDAQACSLMLKDPEKDELVIRASHGLSDEIVEETRVAYGEGIAGRVARTGEPMLLANLQEDPRFAGRKVTPRADIVSSICVPLKDEEGRVQGVLSIRRRSPAAAFTEEDVKLFSVFASQAALAISNAQLYGELRDRVQELSTLYEASRGLSSASSLRDAARALVQMASRMMGGVPSMLLLLDGAESGTVAASSRVPAKLRKAVANATDGGVVAWMRRLRAPRRLSVSSKSRPAAAGPLMDALQDTFSRVSLVPLVAEDAVVAMLVLGDRDGKLPEQSSMRLLSIVASQAATIMKNAGRYEERMERKELELTALYELSGRIGTAGSLKEAFDSILDIVRDIVSYDESFISTLDHERNVLVVQACRGLDTERLRGAEFAFGEDGLNSWVIGARKAVVSPDIGKDPRFGQPSACKSTVRSFMAIPLIVHDEVVGVLNVHGYAPSLYSEENLRTLSVIASQAAALYKEVEALNALASYTDDILRSIAAGVITVGRDGKVLTWNRAAENILRIPASKAADKQFSELVAPMGFPESDRERIIAAVNGVLETGETYVGYKQELRPGDGETLYVNMNVAQLRDRAGDTVGLVIILEDVTKETEMERHVRRVSELASIGQLAASISHELRNPLSSIKGAAQYLRKEYEDHAAVREFLDIIVEEVDGLNKITTEFLEFARPVQLSVAETDVNDVLFRTVQFMQQDIARHKVHVEQRLAYDVPRILADNKQLEQVFRNMILNAHHAMPDGGTLRLSSETAEDGVKVILADDGVGIGEEDLEQVFAPFFTTKTKGTGLGLAIVQKIIDDHGGNISVRSVVGQGTTFEVLLPVCSERARAAIIHMEEDAEGAGPSC